MSLKKNVLANYLGQGWRTLMSLAFVPLYIKHLGMEAYGLIGIFAMLQVWLTLLDMGMKPALGREMARFMGGAHNPESIWDLLRSIEIISIVIAIALAISVWVISSWLATDWVRAERISVDSVAQAFSLMGIVTALQFVESIYTSSLSGLQKQVLQNVVTSFMATIRGIGALAVLVWVSPTITAFFIWQGLISLLTVLFFATVVYRVLPSPEHRPQLSISALDKVWRYAAGMMGITLLSLLLTQVDKLILSRLLTLESFGFYALAVVVSGTLYALISPVTAAYYPRFVELLSKEDGSGVRRAYHQGAQLITVLMGSAAIVLIVNAELVIQLWVSDPRVTRHVAPLIVVLALGTLLNGLMWIPFQMQIANGWTALSVKVNTASVLIVVPLMLWIVPQYGALGAAWVGVALNASCLVIATYFMHRRILLTEKWLWVREDILIPLAVAGGTALICQILMRQPNERFGCFVVLLTSSMIVLIATSFSASLVRVQLTRLLFGK